MMFGKIVRMFLAALAMVIAVSVVLGYTHTWVLIGVYWVMVSLYWMQEAGGRKK